MFRSSTYVEEQPKVVKKGSWGCQECCHARRRGYQVCQEKHWKNLRRTTNASQQGKSKPSHGFFFKLGLILFLK